MKRYRLITGLFIFCCMIVPNPAVADTDTVDTEVVAATEAGPEAVKNLELKAIKTIKSDVPRMEKDHACRILRVIGTVDSVEALGVLLAEEENSHIARYALESMKFPEADKALRDALGKTSGQVKVGIIHSLAMRANARNVSALLPLLDDENTAVAGAAAWALGRTASQQAVSALSKCYEDASAEVRAAAADGLLCAADRFMAWNRLGEALAIYKQLNSPDAPEHVRMGAFAGTIEAQPEKAADLLMEAVQSDDWKIRGMAIDMVVTLEGEGVTERFAADLYKLDAETQVLMLDALVARGEEEALRPVITDAVSSRHPELRELAIKSLGDIGNADSVEVLVGVLDEGGDEGSSLSASSLRRLSGKDINGQIVRSMETSDNETKAQLIEILHDRDASEAVDELLVVASDSNAGVREAAFEALADLAGPEDQRNLVKLLVNLKGDTGRAEAERAVIAVSRKLDETEATRPLLAAMDSSTTTKCSLLRVLGGIGGDRAFEVVRGNLDDRNSKVRDTAVRTLADWPDATAARALLKIFKTTSNRTHRILALRGCVRQLSANSVRSDKALDICRELLEASYRPDEKKQILACLGKSDDPDAINIVKPLLSDDAVCTEAGLAMIGVIRNVMGSAPDQAKAAAEYLHEKSQSRSIRRQANALIELIGRFRDYVMAWRVCGPYSRPFADTFDAAFGPEEGGIEPVVWKPLPISETGNRPWMFDLGAALGGRRKAGYVRTWVHCDREQPARIEYGTDDGNKLWLNGKLVHADRRGGAAVPGEHKIPVTLQKGWNELMLKVTQDTSAWQFCLAIRNANGGKFDGLRVQSHEPAQ
jgi:HEAT repeat protein